MTARAKQESPDAASGDVADRAVDHIARGAPVLGDVLHDLADQRPRFVAAIDDDHVARPDQFERPVDGKIVARPGAHGEGGAHQPAAAMERPQPSAPAAGQDCR